MLVEWPWRAVDPESANSWDGTVGFPRDPDAYDWRNTPWRVEPETVELGRGDSCFVGIPTTEVQVTAIERFEPPADFGFLPRPVVALEVCPIEYLQDEEAGYVLYLNSDEPIDIEGVRR
ncbi:hypothetical protein [Micromonospora sp. DT31]|uniref:hypothetical protein n=1 Tax=Micromonospora sp. DT31 TaxID=3393434 RepID=UPI003CF521F0